MCIYRGVDHAFWTCDSPNLSHSFARSLLTHLSVLSHLPPFTAYTTAPLEWPRPVTQQLSVSAWTVFVAGWAWWVSYLFWRKQFGGFSSFTTCRNDEIQQLHSEHSDKNTRNSYIHNLAVIIWLSNLQNAVCAGCADTEDFSYESLFWILTRVTRAVWIHFNM